MCVWVRVCIGCMQVCVWEGAGVWGVYVGVYEHVWGISVCGSVCALGVCRWGVAGVWGVYVVVCEHVWGEVWGGGECVWGWCVRWVCVGAGMRVGGYAGVSG